MQTYDGDQIGGYQGRRHVGTVRRERLQRCKIQEDPGVLCVWILGVVMFSLMYTYVKTYKMIYFKYVQFIECQLFLTKSYSCVKTNTGSYFNYLFKQTKWHDESDQGFFIQHLFQWLVQGGLSEDTW